MPTHKSYDDGHVEELLNELAATPEQDPRWEQIRSELVRIHIPLGRHVARRYTGHSEPREDIEQAAMLGLVKAINRYDPAYGGKFLAFAMPTMIGEVKRHFRDRTWAMRIPRRLQELHLVLRTARQDFIHENGRPPTIPEVCALLGITEEEAIETLGAADAYQTISLDVPASEDGDSASLGDLIGNDDPELETILDRDALRPMLERLPARERTILLHRFYGNKSQAEIADLLGISQMHVSRLISKTLAQLRREFLQDA
jgi:RNA polymerase sigma-B factor